MMQEVTSIENISICTGWENNYPILLLKNHGQQGKIVEFLYLEIGMQTSETWKKEHVPIDSQLKVNLPEDFENWIKFGFNIDQERQLAPISDLEELLAEIKRQMTVELTEPKIRPSVSQSEQVETPKSSTDEIQIPHFEGFQMTGQPSIDYQQEAEINVQETGEKIRELARAYREGEAIKFENIEKPTSSQNVTLILNFIGSTIRKWKNELEQHTETNQDLIDTLKHSEQCLKDKLKTIRGDSTPVPDSLELETDIKTETELVDILNKCSYHTAWFEGRLFGYEERTMIGNLEEYNQFIPLFIKDRLFNGAARFLNSGKLPKQLSELLNLVGLEVVPIDIGKTQADARIHAIQASRKTECESGSIVEVLLPGLRRIADGEIIQKPVVIRGE